MTSPAHLLFEMPDEKLGKAPTSRADSCPDTDANRGLFHRPCKSGAGHSIWAESQFNGVSDANRGLLPWPLVVGGARHRYSKVAGKANVNGNLLPWVLAKEEPGIA